jgi:GTP-binding protein
MNKMMKVFLIGRYSVGKSSLFNKIAKKRNIVMEEKATTRDVLREEIEFQGRHWLLADSAGLEDVPLDGSISIQQKIMIDEMKESDVVILVVDGTTGITPQDENLVNFLRKKGILEKTILAVNKADKKEYNESEFYALGLPIILPISAISGRGVYELLEACLPWDKNPVPEEEALPYPVVAIVGKPNAGKSTLMNALLGEQRILTSDVEFTTRDPIREKINWMGSEYLFVDTAGLRSSRLKEFGPIYISMKRTHNEIAKADIVLFMIDSTTGIAREDQKIAQMILDNKKACILILNKKDLMENPADIDTEIKVKLRFLEYSPRLYISALNHTGVDEIFSVVPEVYKSYTTRISTHPLNKMIRKILIENPIPMGSRKVLYATQASTKPPTFVLFVNHEKQFTDSYIHFFKKRITEEIPLYGTPVQIIIRGRREEKK